MKKSLPGGGRSPGPTSPGSFTPFPFASKNAQSWVTSYWHGAQLAFVPGRPEMPGHGPTGGSGGGGGAIASRPRIAGAYQFAIAGRRLLAGIMPPG